MLGYVKSTCHRGRDKYRKKGPHESEGLKSKFPCTAKDGECIDDAERNPEKKKRLSWSW